MEEPVVAFVRAAGRPCTAEEIMTACSLPVTECQQSLTSLVLANQLGSEVVSFGEDEQCTLYWHPTTATSSSGHPDEAERQAELATLRSRLQELDAQIAQHAPKETAYNKEIGEHMERVHDYHELKDVAQALMGRLATIEGVLTRDLYKRYDLDLED